MEGHAKKRVTLNLKAYGWYCRNCYIIDMTLDLEYVEINLGVSPILQIQLEIWKLILKNASFHVTWPWISRSIGRTKVNFRMPSSSLFQQFHQISNNSSKFHQDRNKVFEVIALRCFGENLPPITEHIVFFHYTSASFVVIIIIVSIIPMNSRETGLFSLSL